MLQRTAVVAVLVGLVTLLAGLVSVHTSAEVWVVLLAGLPVVGATAVLTRRVLHRRPRLAAVPTARRTATGWLVTVAAAVHVAWVLAWTWTPSWGVWLLPGLPVLTWAECGAALLVRNMLLRVPTAAEQQERQRRAEKHAVAELSPETRKFREALDEGDWGYVQILGDVDQRGPHTLVFHTRVPARATARILQEESSGEAKRTLLPFNEGSGPALAAALSQVWRHKLREKWVQVNSTGYAGYFDVVVNLRDVMADVHPFVDDPTPLPPGTPCDLGVRPDGSKAELPLEGHGVIVATSQVGKTNLLYVITSHLLRTGNVVWVGGRRKQYETWAQFLLKYLDSRHKMVIDWLVNGQYGTLELLLATYLVAQDKQATPFDERDDWSDLTVVLDEISDVLLDTSVVIFYQGQWLNASDLLAMIMRGVKGSRIKIIVVLHKFINSQFGSQGSVIRSWFDWVVVLRSGDRDDAMRALGVSRLPDLEHPGELYFRVGNGPVVRAKAWYVQEIGKATAPKTDGVTVPEVGWSRRDLRRTLDPRGAVAAGQRYAERHQYVTAEFLAYLQRGDDDQRTAAPVNPRVQGGEPVVDSSGSAVAAGGTEATEQAAYERYLAKLKQAVGMDPSSPQAPVADPGGGATSAPAPTARRKVNRRELVLQIFDDLGAIESGQLIEEMRERGDPVKNAISVYNLLAQLRDQDEVVEQLPDKRWARVQSTAA